MISWTALYALDGLGVALFAVSYYFNCYRKGYRIDLWHAHLFLFCVFPYLLMLPFARSELNAIIVGQDFASIVDVVPFVFVVAFSGYCALFAGAGLWSIRAGVGVRKALSRWLSVGPRGSMMLMSSQPLLVFLTLLCLASQMLVLALYFRGSGFGFNVRAYTFENPSIRPLSQMSTLCSMVVLPHCMARYIDTKERSLLACALLLTFGLLFFGQRGNLIFAYLNLVLCYVIYRRREISLVRLLSAGVGSITLILYLGSVRSGIYSVGAFLASMAFLAFYGNNFCDLRDFAWIYSRWNHEFWVGKTYIAGLLTFFPRSISEFRGTWSFGIATDWTVGLDTELHPGLKPGEFGEAFFNFGWVGVIIAGLLIGLLVRRADRDAKLAFSSAHPSIVKAFASTMLINVALCLSSSLGLPYLYALFGMYLIAWLFLRVQALIQPRGFSIAELPSA